MATPDQLLTTKELCKLLAISQSTFYAGPLAWFRPRAVVVSRTPRYRASDIALYQQLRTGNDGTPHSTTR